MVVLSTPNTGAESSPLVYHRTRRAHIGKTRQVDEDVTSLN